MLNNTPAKVKPNGQIIAEFLGWKFEIMSEPAGKRYWVLTDPEVRMQTRVPADLWGTEEETYNYEVKSLCKGFGRWGGYHDDYNKQISVVEKIESLEKGFSFVTTAFYTKVYRSGRPSTEPYVRSEGLMRKDHIYNAIVQFISKYSKEVANV